jgi:hypothetical protein
LDLSPSAFRLLSAALVQYFGLRVFGISGPKFARDELLTLLSDLRDKGMDISIDTAASIVHVGGKGYPVTSTSTGKSGKRGRPRHETAQAEEAI